MSNTQQCRTGLQFYKSNIKEEIWDAVNGRQLEAGDKFPFEFGGISMMIHRSHTEKDDSLTIYDSKYTQMIDGEHWYTVPVGWVNPSLTINGLAVFRKASVSTYSDTFNYFDNKHIQHKIIGFIRRYSNTSRTVTFAIAPAMNDVYSIDTLMHTAGAGRRTKNGISISGIGHDPVQHAADCLSQALYGRVGFIDYTRWELS